MYRNINIDLYPYRHLKIQRTLLKYLQVKMLNLEANLIRIAWVLGFLLSKTFEQTIQQKIFFRGRNLVGDGYLDEYAISQQPLEP